MEYDFRENRGFGHMFVDHFKKNGGDDKDENTMFNYARVSLGNTIMLTTLTADCCLLTTLTAVC